MFCHYMCKTTDVKHRSNLMRSGNLHRSYFICMEVYTIYFIQTKIKCTQRRVQFGQCLTLYDEKYNCKITMY